MATSVALSPEVEMKLDMLVRESGSSRSEVVRQAVLLYARKKSFVRLRQSERDIAEGRVYEGDLSKLVNLVD